jgi:hypothetical protein
VYEREKRWGKTDMLLSCKLCIDGETLEEKKLNVAHGEVN